MKGNHWFYRLSVLLLLCDVYTVVSCSVHTAQFYGEPSLNNKICTESDRMFQVSARSKISCSQMCDVSSECTSLFYNTATKSCTICRGSTNVEEQSGTIFLAKHIELVSCGTPPSPANVKIDYSGSAVYGDQATYTCDPCSYSPAGGVGVITCQADGTWTTPSCAPDGRPIPDGSKGCVSTHGQRCLGSSLLPHVYNALRSDGRIGNCWCGRLCCLENFGCCFDVDC
ncbi:uncharacterized protein LOC123553431 [Mercenaria mercenaria]|uniref:uncharacterized protein LOC123553431 n=1 Tax=Mercenaria mercenaria TaxID=6596 RepID=UPI00234F7C04|nr:uncharacterized protein LOC123553431 [Mercenaria mercenaria]